MGTNGDYFQHYQYGARRALEFDQGHPFDGLFDVVLGAEVAKKLGYNIGDSLVLSHGVGATSFSNHDDSPFHVSGILHSTGTPVDQTLHVSLEAIEAIHLGWQQGVKIPGSEQTLGDAERATLTPDSITALLVGLTSKMTTFRLQREINDYDQEPLLAILPGATLTEFWQTLSTTENTLRLISILVLIASLLGLSALLLASIRERQREISVIRMLGASPWVIFLLIQIEAILITFAASLIAISLLAITLALSADQIAARFGLHIGINFLSKTNLLLLLFVMLSSFFVCLIPSISAYRKAT